MKTVKAAKVCHWMLFAWAIVILLGCSSSPTVRYYTLMEPTLMEPALREARPAADVNRTPVELDVLPVEMPSAVDRDVLVVRQGEAEVIRLREERWAGALPEEMQRAVRAALVHRLAALPNDSDVAANGEPPSLQLRMVVQRMDAWPGHRARLEVQWSLRLDTKPRRQAQCYSLLEREAPRDYAALVTVYQRMIAALADDMAQASESLLSARHRDERVGASCP